VPEPTEGVEHLIYMALLEDGATGKILDILSAYEPEEAARIIRGMPFPTMQRNPAGRPRNWGAFIVARAHVLPVEELVDLRELGLDLGQYYNPSRGRKRLAGLPDARWAEAIAAARDGHGYSNGFLQVFDRNAAEVLS